MDEREFLRKYKHDYYQRNKQRLSALSSRWKEINSDRVRENSERYYQRNRDSIIEYQKQYGTKYPERLAARYAVNEAVKRGDLIRPDECEMCGKKCKPHGHHAAYSRDRWLVVIWLCAGCHRYVHEQQKKIPQAG